MELNSESEFFLLRSLFFTKNTRTYTYASPSGYSYQEIRQIFFPCQTLAWRFRYRHRVGNDN